MAVINPQLPDNDLFQPAELGGLLAPDPNGLSARVSRAASTALHYTAFAIISVRSVYFFKPGTITILFLELLTAANYYTVRFIRAVTTAEAIPVEDIKVKAKQIARIVFWILLIGIPLSTGLAGAHLLNGSVCLLHGMRTAKALPTLGGLSDVAFVLGYIIPLIKYLSKFSYNFHENYNNLVKRLEDTIRSFQEDPNSLPQEFTHAIATISERFAISSSNSFDFDSVITSAEHLSDTFLQTQFIRNLPGLSPERIFEITAGLPNTFTIAFLANHLSKEQFDAVVRPKINRVITSSERLQEIDDGLAEKNTKLKKLYDRKNAGEDHAILLQEAEELSTTISGHTYEILQLLRLIRSLPEKPLPEQHTNWQNQIDSLKNLRKRVDTLYKGLSGEEEMCIRPQLRRFLSSVSPQKEALDMEEESYLVLTNYAFKEWNFKELGIRLGISEEDLKDCEIKRTYKYLRICGLSNRHELIQHQILDIPQDGQNLTVDEISRRIVTFCNNEGNQQPLQVENKPQPRWTFVANAANTLFHIMFSAGLVTFQISRQPISTLLGFALRLRTDNLDISSSNFYLNLLATQVRLLDQLLQYFYQSPPSYIHHGFTELMQELFNRTSVILLTLELSFVGGVASGFHMANDLSNSSLSMQSSFRRWRIARA